MSKEYHLCIVSPNGGYYRLCPIEHPDDSCLDAEWPKDMDCSRCAFNIHGCCRNPIPMAEDFCRSCEGYYWKRIFFDEEEYEIYLRRRQRAMEGKVKFKKKRGDE